MTKADIVNEITKNTGIDKTTVLTTVEAFMDRDAPCVSSPRGLMSFFHVHFFYCCHT